MSHVLRVGVADQIAYFRAYNTDGSAKTDLTSLTTGLTLSVFRVGASSVSIASLSNKAADNTAHADGAIRNVGGNLYTIDIPDAATATQVPSIVVRGSYTGGVIEGLEHPIVAYDPSLAYQQQLWAAATSTVNLSGTTIKTATDVEADTLDIQSRIPLTLDNGNMRSSVQSMATNVLTASALASDAVAEIQSGLALESTLTVIAGYLDTEIAAIKAKTDNLPSDPASASTLAASFVTVNTKLDAIDDYVDSEVAAIKTVTDRINGMLVLDGSVYQYTANALELGPSGSTSVSVYPTQLQAEDRNVEGPIKIYTGEYGEQYFHALDANLDPIDLTGITLELRFGDSIQKNILYTAKTSDNTIVVSNTNKVTFTKSLNFTRFEMSTLRFALRDMDEGAKVLLTGPVKLSWAP